MNLNGIKITWLGHATFLVVTPGGKTLILDPWITGNPVTPADKKTIDKLDYMLISHGHSDHFGDAVELAKKHKPDGLAVISVSFDLLEDEPKVRDFLAKQGADFDNLISSHNAVGQKPFADFDVAPLPEYRLYDREGKLRKKWEGGVEQAELDKHVQELLAEK